MPHHTRTYSIVHADTAVAVESNSTTEEERERLIANIENAEHRKHIVYTCALYYCFISVGFCYSIFNPTLEELSQILNVNLEQTSFLFPLRAVGTTAGTIFTGLTLTYYFNRQILLFSCLILKALTTFLVPHLFTIRQLWINSFFNGMFTSSVVVMVNVWLNELWSRSAQIRKLQKREKLCQQLGLEWQMIESRHQLLAHQTTRTTRSNSGNDGVDIGNVLMQALHFFFGLGCILGPSFAEPFLQHPFIGENDHFFANCLVIPYAIASGTALCSALSFVVLFIVYPYEQPTEQQQQQQQPKRSLTIQNSSSHHSIEQMEEEEEENCDQTQLLSFTSTENQNIKTTRRWLRWLIWLASGMFIFTFVFSEGGYFQFSSTFAVHTKLNVTEADAAWVSASLATSFTVFRGLSILIALKFTPDSMIALDMAMVTIGNTLVYCFADHNLYLFVTGVVVLGAGFASVFPSFLPFLERHNMPITDLIGSVITFSGAIGEILSPFFVGLYIDHHPYVLVYVCFLSVALSACALVTMFGLFRLTNKRRNSSSTSLPVQQQQQQQQHSASTDNNSGQQQEQHTNDDAHVDVVDDDELMTASNSRERH